MYWNKFGWNLVWHIFSSSNSTELLLLPPMPLLLLLLQLVVGGGADGSSLWLLFKTTMRLKHFLRVLLHQYLYWSIPPVESSQLSKLVVVPSSKNCNSVTPLLLGFHWVKCCSLHWTYGFKWEKSIWIHGHKLFFNSTYRETTLEVSSVCLWVLSWAWLRHTNPVHLGEIHSLLLWNHVFQG